MCSLSPSRNLWHSCWNGTSHQVSTSQSESFLEGQRKGFTHIHSNKVTLPLKPRSKTASIFFSHRAPTLLGQLHIAFCGSVLYYRWTLRHKVTLIFGEQRMSLFSNMRKIYNTQTNYARVQSVWYINTNEDHQRFIYVPFWTFSVWKLIDLLEVGRFTGRPSVQQMVALLDQRNSFREQHLKSWLKS